MLGLKENMMKTEKLLYPLSKYTITKLLQTSLESRFLKGEISEKPFA